MARRLVYGFAPFERCRCLLALRGRSLEATGLTSRSQPEGDGRGKFPLGESMTKAKGPGQVEITFRYSRHIGPTYIHGGLTLQFDSLRPYTFVSRVQWPGSDNYETSIRAAVEHVLLECQGHLKSTQVILKDIEWDEIASCELGFRNAATEATRAAFQV